MNSDHQDVLGMPANVYSCVVFMFSKHELWYFIKYLSNSRIYFHVADLNTMDFLFFCLNRQVVKITAFIVGSRLEDIVLKFLLLRISARTNTKEQAEIYL